MLIPTEEDVVTVTDLRERTLEVIKKIQKRDNPLIVIYRNKPMAVIISLKSFNEMKETLNEYYNYRNEKG